MQKEKVIMWVIGDPCDDGHGKTALKLFHTNLMESDIFKINLHLSNTWDMCLDNIQYGDYKTKNNAICANYDDYCLTQEQIMMLRNKGYGFWGNASNDPKDYFMEQDMFYDIIVFCINTGAKELGMENVIFKFADTPECSPLNGGYGLFH